jgi:peptidyl-prolyl cis-trans isomerase SurA
MNRNIYALVFLFFSVQALTQAQSLSDKVLLTVDGRDVTAGEFLRMYRKSSDPGAQGDIDTYMEQFIIFKLKVADAMHAGYDTTRAFKTELRGYRDQLAQNYLTDPDVREKLLRAAYQRSLTEINAWHVLVAMPPEASPEDTLKAWKKAVNIRERIIQGEPFEQVARSSSDDPSVKTNGGNLGYFTVFQMITPFEDAAYNLKPGQVSQPVRTPYGYHIIMVASKRPSSGKIKTAHIMKVVPAGASEEASRQAEDTIWSVYRQLIAGASFTDMVKKYSDHKESVSRDGELNWFGAGEILADYAEAAFSLKNKGDISKPVKTVFGWHIIKRLDRRPHGTFEETRQYLESRLSESYLTSLSRKSLVEKLKKEYKYRLYQPAYNWLVENTDTLIIKGYAKYDRQSLPRGPLYTFNGHQLSVAEFASYVEKRASMAATTNPEEFIKQFLETFISDQILSYENSILEKKYPDFRYLMMEFHDGILLFEISGNRVWNKAQEDSAGLYKYYEDNKYKNLTKEAIEARVYTLVKEDGMKSLSAAWKKLSRYPDIDRRLLSRFVSKGDSLLKISVRRVERAEDKNMEGFEWKKGYHEIYIDNLPTIVFIEKVIPPSPLPLNLVKGEMISGYQDYLEKEWIKQLKEKYNVKIDNLVFQEIRKSI